MHAWLLILAQSVGCPKNNEGSVVFSRSSGLGHALGNNDCVVGDIAVSFFLFIRCDQGQRSDAACRNR